MFCIYLFDCSDRKYEINLIVIVTFHIPNLTNEN